MDYEKDTSIDPNSLDIEWLDQPSLMMKYSSISAELHKKADLAKERVDWIKAELDQEIRANPEDFELSKITEATVAAAILQSSKYKKAMQEYLEIRFEWEISRGAVNAIEHKKSALENLVKLHGQQYFAGPSIPRDLSHEWQQKQEQNRSNEAVIKRMKRKEQ